MNRKNDYMKMLSELNNDQYHLYDICSINYRYLSTMIYNSLMISKDVNNELLEKEYFIEWLNSYLADDCITRLDSEVVNWIYNYPEFFDFYKGDWSIDSIINSVIKSWENKPNTKRLNKFGMLYANYVRFLNTQHGQNFLFGTTAVDIMDDMEAAKVYAPTYYDHEQQYQDLIKLKKIVISEIAKDGVEACEAIALWNAIFNTTDKFNLTKAIVLAKADPRIGKLSDMQIRRHLKKLQVKLIKSILKGNRIEEYFNSDYAIRMNGVSYSLRNALEYYLLKTEDELTETKPTKLADIQKIVNGHTNIKAFTKDELRLIISDFCSERNIPCSFSTGYYHGIAKLKVDSSLKNHKTYKMWIYDGGGYKDFYSGDTGYIADLIPSEYFSKV